MYYLCPGVTVDLMNPTTSNKANIKISVITVVRNGMPFVEHTLKSVIGQNYQNLEYIVIDGGSTDGTVDIIKSYESGITKWISENDEGISDAFNKGISLATGNYLLVLNADDALASPEVLEKVVGEIVRNDYPAMLYGDYDILSRSTGEFMSHGRVNFSPKKLIYGQVLPHPCLFTNRSYFEKYGKFDKNFKVAMDYEWLLRGAQKERITHVPMLITKIRNGGISTLDQNRAKEEIILALRRNGYFTSRFSEYRTRWYFLMRAFSRRILARLGLYGAFAWIRNKHRTSTHNKHNAHD